MIIPRKYFNYAKKKNWIREENGKYYLLINGPTEIQIYEDIIEDLKENQESEPKNTKR